MFIMFFNNLFQYCSFKVLNPAEYSWKKFTFFSLQECVKVLKCMK